MDVALRKKTVVTGMSPASSIVAAGKANSVKDRRSTIDSEFREFAEIGEAIAATPARLEKIRFLADYLRRLNRDQLSIATTYFTGRAFPQSDLRTLQVGGSIVYRAMVGAAKLSDAEFRRIAPTHSDAGKTAFELPPARPKPEPFTL